MIPFIILLSYPLLIKAEDTFSLSTAMALEEFLSEYIAYSDCVPDTIYMLGGDEMTPPMRMSAMEMVSKFSPCTILNSTRYVELNGDADKLFHNKVSNICTDNPNLFVMSIQYNLIADTLIINIDLLSPIYTECPTWQWCWDSYDSNTYRFVYSCESNTWNLLKSDTL